MKDKATRSPKPAANERPRKSKDPVRDDHDDALVDEAGKESFPASDPPSFNPQKLAPNKRH